MTEDGQEQATGRRKAGWKATSSKMVVQQAGTKNGQEREREYSWGPLGNDRAARRGVSRSQRWMTFCQCYSSALQAAVLQTPDNVTQIGNMLSTATSR